MGGAWKRVSSMGTEFVLAVGVIPVELFAYQVSLVRAANWPR